MPPRRLPIKPRKRPRQARSAATVEAVLEASARILESQGFDALSTNAVAERAGVSIGSLYQYFPSKHALVAELARRQQTSLLAGLERVLRPAPRSLRDVVRRLVEVAVDAQLRRPRQPLDVATRDVIAISRGMIDAAGRAQEAGPVALVERVTRAILGYLAVPR